MFSFQSHTALEALNCTAFRTYYLREKLCGNICFQQSCFISADTTFKLCVLTFSLQMWQWQEHSIFQSCVLFMQFCSFFQGLLSCIIGQSTVLPACYLHISLDLRSSLHFLVPINEDIINLRAFFCKESAKSHQLNLLESP